MKRLRRYSIPVLVLAAFAIIVLVALVFAGATSGAAFNAYNPDWDGTSELRSTVAETGTEPTVMTDTAEYDELDANETVVFVLAPDSAYDDDETAAVQSFVDRGGTVVIADDVDGASNELLAGLNASTRIDGSPVRDERNYYRAPSLPLVANASDHHYVAGLEEVTLNHGTTLDAGDADVLLETSEFAYLDHNRNEELDDDEELAVRPVVTLESVGAGAVLTVSDPSALINVMLEREDNHAFVTAIAADHDTVAIDTSNTAAPPPLVRTLLFIQGSAPVQLVLGLTGVLSLWAWYSGLAGAMLGRLRSIRGGTSSGDHPDIQGEFTRDELEAWLDSEHPEWDDQRRETVMTAIIDTQSEPHSNE